MNEAADVTPMSEPQTQLFQSVIQMVIPEAALVGFACLLFILAVVLPSRSVAVLVGLLGVAIATMFAGKFGPAELAISSTDSIASIMSPIDPSGVAGFIRWLMLGLATLLLLTGWPELRNDNACEYVGCLLVMVAGASLVGRANDLVSLYLSLEMVSIPTYVLLYLPARSRPGQEAALKYFLLSILSSAVLLFGFSYFYGLTGATNLSAVVQVLSTANADGISPLASVAAVMVVFGLGFKIAAVPFHFYAPDVYQGGPTGVVAQLAVVPKVAGFVALARLFGLIAPVGGKIPFDADSSLIPLILWVLAAATMTIGNVLALIQDNLKRLFAYSGIAHTGYMLIGLLVASTVPGKAGIDAVLFYLVAYSVMTIGAFAILSSLNNGGRSVASIMDLDGLGRSNPLAAGLMAVFLFSLIGLPLTAGFAGKLLLFLSAFEVPASGALHSLPRILVAIAALNAAIGAVYYLRAIGAMYLRSPEHEPAGRSAWPMSAAIVCGLVIVGLGIYPDPLARAARKAVVEPTTVAIPEKAVANVVR